MALTTRPTTTPWSSGISSSGAPHAKAEDASLYPFASSPAVQQPVRDRLGSDASSVGSPAVLEAGMEPAVNERKDDAQDEPPEQLPEQQPDRRVAAQDGPVGQPLQERDWTEHPRTNPNARPNSQPPRGSLAARWNSHP